VQVYVDRYLLTDLPEGGRLAHGAIVSPDSGVWAADQSFPALSQAEATKLAALLKTPPPPVAAAAAAAVVGGRGGSGKAQQQQLVTEVSIGGKAYEARVTAAAAAEGGQPGTTVLMCRSKGGMLGLGGGREGVAVVATGQALVMGLWEDRRAEAGCSAAVQRLAQVLLSYGY
jgi:hypothetical protein